MIGCDATSVLVRHVEHRYTVCKQDCRAVELAARAKSLPALADGSVIAVAASQHVLAIWRENQPPRFVSLPEALVPKLVHANAELIDVIGETEHGLAIARVKL